MTSSLKQSLWFHSALSVYKEGHVAMVTDAVDPPALSEVKELIVMKKHL